MPRWIQRGVGQAVGRRTGRRRAAARTAPRMPSISSATMPAAVGRVGRDADAAVVDRDGLAPASSVCAGGRRAVIGDAGRRRARRDLALAEVAVVERVEALVGERRERRGQGRQPDQLARAPRPAVRPVDREEAGLRPGRRAATTAIASIARRSPSQAGNPSAASSMAGRQDGVPRQPPAPRVRVAPRADGAGHGDRRAGRGAGSRSRPGVAQRGGIGGRRRPTRPVERDLLAARPRPRPARTRRPPMPAAVGHRPRRGPRSWRSPRRRRAARRAGPRARPRSRGDAARRRRRAPRGPAGPGPSGRPSVTRSAVRASASARSRRPPSSCS